MAAGIIYPSSFGTTPTMTLENGTTHFSSRLVTITRRAVISYITLPDQSIYDLDGTDPAPVVPETVTAQITVTLADVAAIDAEWAAWEVHVGKAATLTGTRVGGGTLTCTARLESITNTTPFPDNIDNQMIVDAVFRLKTNWT